MTEPELRETQLSSREIFDGRILHVFEDTVRLPNGAAASREYLRHIGAVCVIPVLEDGSVLVERQYRYPVAQVLTEIPAGKLDAKDEDHLLAAQRELREETGLAARPEEFTLLLREDCRTDAHFDIYALTWEGAPEDIRFQAGETDAARWVPLADWEAVAGTEGTLCPAREEAYKQELYRRIALYLQGQREFSQKEARYARAVGPV